MRSAVRSLGGGLTFAINGSHEPDDSAETVNRIDSHSGDLAGCSVRQLSADEPELRYHFISVYRQACTQR